jgi:endonuclease I
MVKKITFSAFLTIIFYLASFAQVSITSTGTPFTENFDSMESTPATLSSTLPAGWAFVETGTNLNATYLVDNGVSASGNTFSYGTTSSLDRAFGTLQSGSLISTIGASFINNSGSIITSLTVTYTGEQWRLGAAGRVDKLDFQYSLSATSINSGTYIDVNNLDFTAPVATLPLNALDGNLTANKTTVSFTITDLNIPVGNTFRIRWNDFNAAGADDGLAIDDFSITASGTAVSACVKPTEQPTSLLLNATASTVTGSFNMVPAPTTIQNYLIVRSTSATLTQLPADGVNYSPGQVIESGNGVAVGISSDGNFTNAVSPATQYFYFIFALNDQDCAGGPNYNQTAPLNGDVTTPALAACNTPASPTLLNLTPTNTSIIGSFTGSGAGRYLTVISPSSSLAASPVNGTIYTAGQSFGSGTVVSYAPATSFTATGLTVATPYYLFVFAANDACTGEPFYSLTSLDGTTTTTNNTTGIPVGYYDAAAGLTCQPLKTALKNIITTGFQSLSYTPGLWNLYLYSDMRRNDANTADIIWDMYSDNPSGVEPYVFPYGPVASGGKQCGTYTVEGDCYNREHSTPQSWFAQASPMVSDAHHIFPTDGKVNALRSNYPYGEVTNITPVSGFNNPSLNGSKLGTGAGSQNFGYTGIVFEPINEYKGDLARAGLYMAVRYEDEILSQNWSGLGTGNQVFLSATDEADAAKRRLQIYDTWQLNLLIKWHTNDIVSQKEIDRNNAIYYQSVNTTTSGDPKTQSNRNPFVDHPEYVAVIFQCTGVVPVTITDFVATKQKNATLLQWYATYETNFKLYEVERSTNGLDFNKIGEIKGQNLANYSFADNNLPTGSIVYYRLKMVDIDGSFKMSKTIAVKLNSNFSNALVYPNPAVGQLQVKLITPLATNTSLVITDITGRIVKQQSLLKGQLSIDVNVQSLPAGRYLVKINDQQSVINQSFIVIK